MNKVIELYGVVSAYRSVEFLKHLEDCLGKNIGILNGGGNLERVSIGKTSGRIRNGWCELLINFEPERKYHVGMYTERECPFRITAKTTARNATRMEELLGELPSPSRYGGYGFFKR